RVGSVAGRVAWAAAGMATMDRHASARDRSMPLQRDRSGNLALSRVLRVDAHVVTREIREEDLGLVPVARQADDVLDLVAVDARSEVGVVVWHHEARVADLHAL